MTDDEINSKLAEYMGWHFDPVTNNVLGSVGDLFKCHGFTSSLDAMALVEKKLEEEGKLQDYCDAVGDILAPKQYEVAATMCYLVAPMEVRARAAAITLGIIRKP